MRWLCDEMLGRLARLLRAAGYDTALAQGGIPDALVLKLARAEGRVLLTRDRALADLASRDAILITQQSVAEQAIALARAYPVDWLHAPFSRCLVDNTLLSRAGAAAAAALPPRSRQGAEPVNWCPTCGRLYWPGSHTARLGRTLEQLSRAGSPAADHAPRSDGQPA